MSKTYSMCFIHSMQQKEYLAEVISSQNDIVRIHYKDVSGNAQNDVTKDVSRQMLKIVERYVEKGLIFVCNYETQWVQPIFQFRKMIWFVLHMKYLFMDAFYIESKYYGNCDRHGCFKAISNIEASFSERIINFYQCFNSSFAFLCKIMFFQYCCFSFLNYRYGCKSFNSK